MGYYCNIEANIYIPGRNVEPVIQAVSDYCERHKGSTALAPVKVEDETRTRVEALKLWVQDHLLECDVVFHEGSALEQLARAGSGTYPDMSIEGYSHQKWRGYLEEFCDVIAPFVQVGSRLHITGEEGERVIYRFSPAGHTEDWARVIFEDEYEKLSAGLGRLEMIRLLLAGTDGADPAALVERIREIVNEP